MSSLVRRRQPDVCQHGTRRYSCDTDSSHSTDFVSCVNDLNDWMHARLRLNPTKTQVMWLGSSQLIKQVDISDISVLSSQVKVVETARDLGVLIDSQLSLSAHVAALCRSGYATTPTNCAIAHYGSCQNTSPRVYILSPGLLQFTSVWSTRQPHQEVAVCPERCGTSHHRNSTM